jgi:peptidoglycan/LPS O-acetylase OafA/YrhL
MHENPERIAQFRAEVAEMKVRDPSTGTDRLLARIGAAGLVGGIACGVVAWFVSHGTRNPLQQRDAIVLGLLGVTIAIVGAALWVKASLASFLRLWLARLSYEQQARADRVEAHTVPVGSPSSDGHAPAAVRDPAVRG